MPDLQSFIWRLEKNAIIFGLSLDLFWNGNPKLYYLFRDIYKEKKEEELIIADNCAWQQGLYELRAFRQIMKEAGFISGGSDITKYPKKPFKVLEEENKPENKYQQIKQRFLNRIEQINSNFK